MSNITGWGSKWVPSFYVYGSSDNGSIDTGYVNSGYGFSNSYHSISVEESLSAMTWTVYVLFFVSQLLLVWSI